MDTTYPITQNGHPVGTARVLREGLFLRIQCLCHIPREEDLHIQAVCGNDILDLGICVPYDKGSGLISRVPTRLFQEDKLEFRLSKSQKENFFPVYPDHPFEALAQLNNSRFQIRDGVPGIIVKDYNDISRPTGQWSEPITSE